MKKETKNMKMKKKEFERLLISKFHLKVLEYSPYRYSDYQDCDAWGTPKQKLMSLYYDDGKHIGSWQSGSCWLIEQVKENEL